MKTATLKLSLPIIADITSSRKNKKMASLNLRSKKIVHLKKDYIQRTMLCVCVCVCVCVSRISVDL